MTFRARKAFYLFSDAFRESFCVTGIAHLTFSLVLVMMLAACQSPTNVPPPTQQATPGGPPLKITLPVTPTATVVVEPTATLEPHLNVDSSQLRGKTIDFWHPWQADLAQRAAEAAEQFNRENEWGIKVRVRSLYSPGALFDEVQLIQQVPPADADPEVVAATSDQLAALAAGDRGIVDLRGYVAHPQLGWSEGEVQAINPVFWAQDLQGEKRLGVPALRSATVLFYNQTWAEELGFTSPPQTPAEFRQQACAAAVQNNQPNVTEKNGTGGYLVSTGPTTALSWMAVFGANPVPQQPGQPYQFKSDAGQDALDFLHDMFTNGCAWLGRKPEPHTYFVQRMALFYSGSLSDVYVQKRIMEGTGSSDKWVILPFPGSDGKPVVYASGYSYAALPGSVEQQMASWLFIRWMSQPSIQAKLAEAQPSLPVSSAVVSQLADYQTRFPWNAIIPMADSVRPVPADGSWRVARRVLEDAFREIFYMPAEQVKSVLPLVDSTIAELLEREP